MTKTTGINGPKEGEWIVKKSKSQKKQDQLGKNNRFGKKC